MQNTCLSGRQAHTHLGKEEITRVNYFRFQLSDIRLTDLCYQNLSSDKFSRTSDSWIPESWSPDSRRPESWSPDSSRPESWGCDRCAPNSFKTYFLAQHAKADVRHWKEMVSWGYFSCYIQKCGQVFCQSNRSRVTVSKISRETSTHGQDA